MLRRSNAIQRYRWNDRLKQYRSQSPSAVFYSSRLFLTLLYFHFIWFLNWDRVCWRGGTEKQLSEAKWSEGLFIAPMMGSKKMRNDTKLTIGLRRLTPELLLPTDASPVPNLVATRSVSQPKLHEPQQQQKAHQTQHHTDDFLHSTMKLFLLVTPPAARMQVACPLLT